VDGHEAAQLAEKDGGNGEADGERGVMSKSRQKAPEPEPDIHIHYLGHSSFILQFDNGITVLTDYGASNSCGFF
jgi:hypothetical protein